ncbi:MAG TPA: hypothetical protein VGF56_13235 [Rhizomicrobium sp.]|jgi:hypothetical protein
MKVRDALAGTLIAGALKGVMRHLMQRMMRHVWAIALYVTAGVLALVALLYAMSALWYVIGAWIGPVWASLVLSGLFLLLMAVAIVAGNVVRRAD